jgi:hypothetical protein
MLPLSRQYWQAFGAECQKFESFYPDHLNQVLSKTPLTLQKQNFKKPQTGI